MEKRNIDKTVELIQKFYAGELTEEEKEEMEGVLQNESLRAICEQLGKDDVAEQELRRYDRWNRVAGKAAFDVRLRKSRILYWGKRLLVAASLLLLISVGLLVLNQSRKIGIEPVQTIASSEAVGQNAVRLRLADGQELALEHNQQELMQEDGTMIRVDNGKLSYETVAETDVETGDVKYNELYVPRGGECFLVLEDGTKVWLNAESYLKYPVKFKTDVRRVEIRGEGFFEVTKGERPFLLNTPSGEVKVLGTAFGVCDYENEVAMTTLVSGRVRFTSLNGEQVELLPDEQAYVSMDGKLEKRQVNVDEFVAWRDGWYVFREATLEKVMQVMCRWYDVDVFYQSQALKDLHFTGNLRRYDSIETFLKVLARSGQVKYTMNRNTVVLYQ